jgi:hypothetical protein
MKQDAEVGFPTEIQERVHRAFRRGRAKRAFRLAACAAVPTLLIAFGANHGPWTVWLAVGWFGLMIHAFFRGMDWERGARAGLGIGFLPLLASVSTRSLGHVCMRWRACRRRWNQSGRREGLLGHRVSCRPQHR